MKNIKIADATLRQVSASADISLSFKEKIELVKELSRLGVNIIETAPVSDGKTDSLLIKTLAMNSGDSVLSCAVGITSESVAKAWEAVRSAPKSRLHVIIPVSPVKMEYDHGMKPDAVLKAISEIVAECAGLCADVEFSADDATRAQPAFLREALEAAIKAGAKTVTLCDTAGILMPNEYEAFIGGIRAETAGIAGVTLGFQCSSGLKMGTASVFAAIAAGVDQVALTVNGQGTPSLQSAAEVFRLRGDSLGIQSDVDMTGIRRAMSRLTWMSPAGKGSSPFDNSIGGDTGRSAEALDKNSTIADVCRVLGSCGYALSPDDEAKVYEAFLRIAAKKETIVAGELDAIVASVAMQVPPTYKIINYVINSGNIIKATANIVLEKDGTELRGMAVGDGPVDAAFLAIEQIVGRRYELDDFQIAAVTEGRGAMGSALVKLRGGSGLCSGRGVSTDIIGASIRAYVDALNKIAYEEGNQQ